MGLTRVLFHSIHWGVVFGSSGVVFSAPSERLDGNRIPQGRALFPGCPLHHLSVLWIWL